MTILFWTCFALGATVLAAQIVLTMLGVGHGALEAHLPLGDGHVHMGDSHAAEGLDLLSVRALSAGVAMFGAAGLGFDQMLPSGFALLLAVSVGFAALYGTAWLSRQMMRLESSGSLRLEGAVGREARVYLTVPGSSAGAATHGLVHVALQGRTVELRAVTREPRALPTGSSAVVISVADDGETVEVVPTSTFEELIDGPTR